MRNHDEKIKDMVESILPSKHRKGARDRRAAIHRRERAQVRASLHQFTRLVDADDYEGDLDYEDREAMIWLVEDRRDADKVAPLLRWVERRVAKDPALASEDWDGRRARFAALFGDNTVGCHALSHIEWAIGTPPASQFRWFVRPRPPVDEPPDELLQAVEAILAAGAHGELNRRIRHEVGNHILRTVRTPEGRVQDREERPRRFLGGHHDRDAFVAAVQHRSEARVVRTLAREIG